MLVLSRKEGESIMIGGDIVITVTKIKDHERVVRIGIEAPDHVRILRKELYDPVIDPEDYM